MIVRISPSSMESVRKPIQDQANQQQMILGSLGAISLFVAALSALVVSAYLIVGGM